MPGSGPAGLAGNSGTKSVVACIGFVCGQTFENGMKVSGKLRGERMTDRPTGTLPDNRLRMGAEMRTRINKALHLLYEHGQAAGEEHKQWLIDQVVRVLTGDDYPFWVKQYENPEGDEIMASWETGVAPFSDGRPSFNPLGPRVG
jgi:hypothetical protein